MSQAGRAVAAPGIAAVVLAAGAGKRMQDESRAKVCHEVAPGVTAISFLLGELAKAGVNLVSVVVGVRAEEVRAEVAPRFPSAIFAHQAEQLGTGHATRCGAQPLLAAGAAETLLVAMGDKMTTARVLRRLIRRHREAGADLTFAASPCAGRGEQGRVVVDEDARPLAIVETPDLVAARAWGALEAALGERDPLPSGRVTEILEAALPASGKVPPVLRGLLEAASVEATLSSRRARELAPGARATVALPGRDADPDWVEEHAPLVNEALYAFSPRGLRFALERMSPDNAQGEIYLPDAVAELRARPEEFTVAVCEVDPSEIATFNTREQLEEVRASVARWMGEGG